MLTFFKHAPDTRNWRRRRRRGGILLRRWRGASEKHCSPKFLPIGGKLCLAAIFPGNFLHCGQADSKAPLRLAGEIPAIDPPEPLRGGVAHHDGKVAVGKGASGPEPAAALPPEGFHRIFQQIAQHQTHIRKLSL